MLTRFVVVGLVVASSLAMPTAGEQSTHDHTPAVSGGPSGVPHFCAQPSISSIASGAWSDGKTWSAGRIPVARDRVKVASGHRVTYDVASDAALDCLAIDGDVRFDTTVNTRVRLGNLTVMEQGSLEVGNETTPVSPAVSAEIIITDSPIDKSLDPMQIGTGIQGLGRITMHGFVKMPTFLRLRREPLAGATALSLEQTPQGWRPGDRVVIPDTRQLRVARTARQNSSRTSATSAGTS